MPDKPAVRTVPQLKTFGPSTPIGNWVQLVPMIIALTQRVAVLEKALAASVPALPPGDVTATPVTKG
jgi:hypothetical protein